MTDMLRRRDFLKSSTAFAATMAAGFGCIEIASAAPIQAPTINKLSVHVLVDSSFDLFARPTQAAGVTVAAPPRTDARANLHSEWGLSQGSNAA
jgi:7,8-dihydropterin-6-yl-methyl-4-(beta-D-ribofuranosyl)aminobenzene 5'-phosphate synthase